MSKREPSPIEKLFAWPNKITGKLLGKKTKAEGEK